MEDECVDIGFVKFVVFGEVFAKIFEFLYATDADLMMALWVVTGPDGERCAPEAVSGEGPVFDISDEVSEAALLEMCGEPVDLIVIFDEGVLYF